MKTTLFRATLGLSLLWAMTVTTQAAPYQHPHPSATATTTLPKTTATTAPAPVVQVQNAWVRATVPGQKVAGVYMQLQALQSGITLLELHSPAAPIVQIHNMQMQGDVMRMFEVKSLDLPRGQPVNLQTGGLHIMLMDLPQALVAGKHIELELRFTGGLKQTLTLPILAGAPSNAMQTAAPHHDHH